MIETSVLKVLSRLCPNYHLVSEKFAKGTYSLCTCAKCANRSLGKTSTGKPERWCYPLYLRLRDEGLPIGYSRVDENGTCDAARFVPEDNTRFHLEGEKFTGKAEKSEGTAECPYQDDGVEFHAEERDGMF